MTVKELIKELKKMPRDFDVIFDDHFDFVRDIESVRKIETESSILGYVRHKYVELSQL